MGGGGGMEVKLGGWGGGGGGGQAKQNSHLHLILCHLCLQKVVQKHYRQGLQPCCCFKLSTDLVYFVNTDKRSQ